MRAPARIEILTPSTLYNPQAVRVSAGKRLCVLEGLVARQLVHAELSQFDMRGQGP